MGRRSLRTFFGGAFVVLVLLVVGGLVARGYSVISAQREARKEAATAVLAATKGRVVVYSAEWCPACRQAKAWLGDHGVAYEVRDVDLPTTGKEYRTLGGGGIPRIVVDGEALPPGFAASRLREALASHQMQMR